MNDTERIPTWDEGIEILLAKLPRVLGQATHLTINDCRVIHYLAAGHAEAVTAERERIAKLAEQYNVDYAADDDGTGCCDDDCHKIWEPFAGLIRGQS